MFYTLQVWRAPPPVAAWPPSVRAAAPCPSPHRNWLSLTERLGLAEMPTTGGTAWQPLALAPSAAARANGRQPSSAARLDRGLERPAAAPPLLRAARAPAGGEGVDCAVWDGEARSAATEAAGSGGSAAEGAGDAALPKPNRLAKLLDRCLRGVVATTSSSAGAGERGGDMHAVRPGGVVTCSCNCSVRLGPLCPVGVPTIDGADSRGLLRCSDCGGEAAAGARFCIPAARAGVCWSPAAGVGGGMGGRSSCTFGSVRWKLRSS